MMLDTDVEGARRELAALASTGSPRAVRVDAHSLLGESYAAAHEIDAALREYAEAARLGRGTAGGATALFDGARLSERSGDTDAAREGFERYLRDYPDGANAVQARNRLEALGGTTGR
jgi:TolA-binding protein